MKSVIAMATAVALTAILPNVTFAQANQTQTQHNPSVRAQVKQTLESAGFSEVRIMPESFLVRAKDPGGNPVMMVINPDSFTAVTELGNSQNNGTSPSGSTAKNQGQTSNQTVDNEKIPGRANGSLAELKENYKANLTAAQKKQIWQNLSSGKMAMSDGAKGFTPQLGAIVPGDISIQPLPNEVTTEAPSLKGYDYAMLQNEIVIVSPNSKKVVDIIKQQ